MLGTLSAGFRWSQLKQWLGAHRRAAPLSDSCGGFQPSLCFFLLWLKLREARWSMSSHPQTVTKAHGTVYLVKKECCLDKALVLLMREVHQWHTYPGDCRGKKGGNESKRFPFPLTSQDVGKATGFWKCFLSTLFVFSKKRRCILLRQGVNVYFCNFLLNWLCKLIYHQNTFMCSQGLLKSSVAYIFCSKAAGCVQFTFLFVHFFSIEYIFTRIIANLDRDRTQLLFRKTCELDEFDGRLIICRQKCLSFSLKKFWNSFLVSHFVTL